jgi:hypothetical protein
MTLSYLKARLPALFPKIAFDILTPLLFSKVSICFKIYLA